MTAEEMLVHYDLTKHARWTELLPGIHLCRDCKDMTFTTVPEPPARTITPEDIARWDRVS